MAKANREGAIVGYFETADLAAATVLFNIVKATMKRRQGEAKAAAKGQMDRLVEQAAKADPVAEADARMLAEQDV